VKKQCFIYILLCAYSCSAFAVKSTVQQKQLNQNTKAIESSIDDDVDKDDTDVEVVEKPTVLESWGKVVSLEWSSLSRDDALNIGACVTLAGVVYYIYSSYPKKTKLAGPAVGNQPPQDPFGGLTPEELQEQWEALAALEQRHLQLQRQKEMQRIQAEKERIAQAQQELARQAALQQQQELQRQQEEARHQKAIRKAQRQAQRLQEMQEDDRRWKQQREEVMRWAPEGIDERLERVQQEIREAEEMRLRHCSKKCNIYDCTPCSMKRYNEIEQELIHEIYAQELQQKAAEKERQQQKQKINCTICFEGKNLSEFYVMSCCNYSGCKECFIEMIDTHLNEHNTKDLNCPNQKCAKKIEEKDIHIITLNNKDVYERYLAITCKECLADDPNLKHCPSRDCPYAFINDEGIRQLMKCPECRQQYCSLCLINHNVRVSCEQAKIERELAENPDKGQKANEKWINENTKPCPNCNVRVEKNGGCLWMLCAKCRHQFCWRCLKPHDHTMNHPCGLWVF